MLCKPTHSSSSNIYRGISLSSLGSGAAGEMETAGTRTHMAHRFHNSTSTDDNSRGWRDLMRRDEAESEKRNHAVGLRAGRWVDLRLV